MARQCPKPKRKRDATWFRDKVLMVKAQGFGKVLNEEELEFLADPGFAEGPITQTVLTHNAAYQVDDLDTYDSDSDDFSTAKAVLMANLSSYGSDVLSDVPHSKNTHNDMLNQSVQEMSYSEQTHLVNYPENEITSDSNIIPYSQYLLETQNAAIRDTNSCTQQDAMILSVFEQLSNQVTNCNKVNKDNLTANESLSAELERYKEWVKLLEERQNVDLTLGFQNPFYLKKAQQIRPMLYDGSVIAKETNVISIVDSEETLMLEEESRSKMLLKQNDSMVLEKKVNIKQINYAELNRLSEDFDINTSMNVNSSVAMNNYVNYVEMCNKCLELEAELIKQHNMVEKDEYNRLSKSFSKLEQHFISLKLAMQLNKEIFQKNNTSVNQTKPSFDQLFELNNLKADLQAKDTTIKKLKANIKRLNKTSTTNSVKKDIDEIETINIELEHRVAKLIAENEHLKQTYKQLYNSIKPSHVRKSFCHNSIKNDLRKFKGKDIVDNATQVSNATTIAPGYVRDTCPDIHKSSEKLVAVMPINKKKTVRVSPSTKSSRSKSTDNTKNDRILQISSSTQKKNKVEDHSRIVKTCLNKRNCVVEPSGNANVQHSKLNTNSELTCVKCNSSMFDARHELCFLEFVSDMNASSKSKTVMKAKDKYGL
ncbi:hypothetical protein Tco_0781598 [Tanacetum coccineum]